MLDTSNKEIQSHYDYIVVGAGAVIGPVDAIELLSRRPGYPVLHRTHRGSEPTGARRRSSPARAQAWPGRERQPQ